MSQQTVKYKHIRTVVIALCFAFSAFCLVAGAAVEGFEMQLEVTPNGIGSYELPVVYVKATKSRDLYDSVEPKEPNLKYLVRVRGQCAEKWRLGGGTLWVRGNDKKVRKDDAVVNYPTDSSHRSIGPDHGQGWEIFPFSIPFMSPKGQSPVDLCNAELDKAGNESARKRLLAEGSNLFLAKAYYTELEVSCDDEPKKVGFDDPPRFFSASTYLPLKVRCYPVVMTKGPPPRTGQQLDPPIESVALVADPPETVGRKCPVYVNFRGKITAGGRSPFATYNTKFRFVGDHDYISDWLPVSIVRGEPRTVNGRRFIQESDTPRGFKTPGGRENIPIFHGWMALEVMLENGTKRSQRTDFSVDCNPQPRIRTTR
jgi:hypothetical protein